MSVSSFQRQRVILEYLKGRNESDALSVTDIKNKLESEENITVSWRTVDRDVKSLELSNGICASEDGQPIRYFLSDDFTQKYKLELNHLTLQALVIALNNLKETSHSYFANVTTEAETAIMEHLDEGLVRKLRNTKKRYSYDSSVVGRPSESDIKDFEKIMYCIRENYLFTCQNHSPSKSEEYNLRNRKWAPHIFVLSSGTPYIICQDMDSLQFRNLKITRLKNVEVTKEKFEPEDVREHVNLDAMIGGYVGAGEETVQVTIQADQAMANHFKEHQIHPSQIIKELNDGTFKISFECAPSLGISRVLSSWGGHIKSIEPQKIYSQVKEIWQKGLKIAS